MSLENIVLHIHHTHSYTQSQNVQLFKKFIFTLYAVYTQTRKWGHVCEISQHTNYTSAAGVHQQVELSAQERWVKREVETTPSLPEAFLMTLAVKIYPCVAAIL